MSTTLLLTVFIIAAAAHDDGEEPVAELLSAITAGDRQRVEELLAARPALVRARTPAGASLLIFCAYARKPELAEVFRRLGAKLDVFEAAALGEASLLEALAREPATVNSYSPDGYTPLSLSAFFGHEEAVRLLLAAGAEVNAVARNPQRVSALHAAIAGPRPDISELLLRAGADPNVRQEGDHTPLHQAAARGLEPVVNLLLVHGASKELRNSDGETPYDLARRKGHDVLADALLR